MTEHLHTIETIINQRVLVVSFTGSNPHLETSLEISNRLAKCNSVDYLHLGKYVSRPTLFSSNFIKRKIQFPIRIERSKNYINKLSNQYKSVRWLEGEDFIHSNFYDIAKDFIHSLDIQFENLTQLRNLTFDQYNIGIGIASTIISHFKDSDPFPLDSKSKIELERLSESSILAILFAKEIVSKKYLYDSVVLLNGRFVCESSFKQIMNQHQVKIYYHECGNPYPINTFYFEDYMPQNLPKRNDEIIKMNTILDRPSITKIGLDFFSRKVSGDGVYESSYVQKHANNLSPILIEKINHYRKTSKKIISYFTSSDDEFDLFEPNYNRYPNFKNQINAVLEIAKTVNELGFLFIVRVHPNLSSKSNNEKMRWQLLGEKIKEYNSIWIDQDNLEPTYEIIKSSDIVISAGSTVGIESIYLEKPSIVIADCYYNQSIPSVITCKSIIQLRNLLMDDASYKKPKKSDSFIYGAWAMAYPASFIYFNQTSKGFGLMADGSRIASPGFVQRFVSLIKQIIS